MNFVWMMRIIFCFYENTLKTHYARRNGCKLPTSRYADSYAYICSALYHSNMLYFECMIEFFSNEPVMNIFNVKNNYVIIFSFEYQENSSHSAHSNNY